MNNFKTNTVIKIIFLMFESFRDTLYTWVQVVQLLELCVITYTCKRQRSQKSE